ncbi:hypothetical protein JKP88DRAFT_290428 [Tribonema minus]|uniref:EamA domain-containing protein n=1 Tax=Tribonema minus TaxID=303371 RepID=A0A835Z542_9STRA|nr:hypothetical protein JKP88DRAFT_290428 [Tribonema minus]
MVVQHRYSLASGILAALASVLGKAGLDSGSFLGSVVATRCTAPDSWVCSGGVAGWLVFGEALPPQWWLGATLIFAGTALVADGAGVPPPLLPPSPSSPSAAAAAPAARDARPKAD